MCYNPIIAMVNVEKVSKELLLLYLNIKISNSLCDDLGSLGVAISTNLCIEYTKCGKAEV